jgi:hypothetical protein
MQTNAVSCGVYVVYYAHQLLSNWPLDLSALVRLFSFFY